MAAFVGGAVSLMTGAARAQNLTYDPMSWRPLSYADLRQPGAAERTFAEIWRDAIDANNRAYLAHGDKRFRAANAPATEAHFVVWSERKSVVLSVLNTATGCTLKDVRAATGATIKLCPLRLAFFERGAVRIMDGGTACFLELSAARFSPARPSAGAAAYASYDPAMKVLKLGLVVDHRAVEGCARNVPLYPS